MSAMLLSIKPKYAKVILEGKKQYEFRKSRPKDGVDRIIFTLRHHRRKWSEKRLLMKYWKGRQKRFGR